MLLQRGILILYSRCTHIPQHGIQISCLPFHILYSKDVFQGMDYMYMYIYFVFHFRSSISDTCMFQNCIWILFLWMVHVCITVSNISFLGTCNFEVDTCDWSNTQTGDEIDWLRHSGSTGNTNTGPALDHTTGSTSGWYMYIDSARGGQGSRARFESSSIDATNGVSCFTMWYHIVSSSSNYGTINVSTFRTKTQNIYSQEEIKPLLYHQIGNINFFIFITN